MDQIATGDGHRSHRIDLIDLLGAIKGDGEFLLRCDHSGDRGDRDQDQQFDSNG